MFEVGKRYQFNMVNADGASMGDYCSFNGKVTAIELPLIKVSSAQGDQIINTQSSGFISAELSKYQSDSLPIIDLPNLE